MPRSHMSPQTKARNLRIAQRMRALQAKGKSADEAYDQVTAEADDGNMPGALETDQEILDELVRIIGDETKAMAVARMFGIAPDEQSMAASRSRATPQPSKPRGTAGVIRAVVPQQPAYGGALGRMQATSGGVRVAQPAAPVEKVVPDSEAAAMATRIATSPGRNDVERAQNMLRSQGLDLEDAHAKACAMVRQLKGKGLI